MEIAKIVLEKLPKEKYLRIAAYFVFVLPLLMDWFLYDKYESIKFAFFLIGVSILWMVAVWQKRHEKFLFNKKLLYLVFIWAGLLALSVIFSIHKSLSFFGPYFELSQGFVFQIAWLMLVVLLIAAFQLNEIFILVKTAVFSGLFVAVYGIIQSFGLGYYGGILDQSVARAPSFLGNPNFAAMFLAILLPFVVEYFSEQKEFWGKCRWIFAALIYIAAILLFGSRGAFLAVLAGLPVYAFFRFRSYLSIKKITVYSAIFLLAFAAIFIKLRPETISETPTFSDFNTESRLVVWDIASRAILEKPWFGYGLGTFSLVYESARTSPVGRGFFGNPHNLFLQIGASMGIAALILFCFGIFWAFGNAVILSKNNNSGAALAGSLFVFVVASLFNPTVIPVWLLLALLLAAGWKSSGVYDKTAVSKFVFVPIFFLAVMAFVWGVKFIFSDHLFYIGSRMYSQGNSLRAEHAANIAAILSPEFSNYKLYYAASVLAQNGGDGNILKARNILKSFEPIHKYNSRERFFLSKLYYWLYLKSNNSEDKQKALGFMLEAKKMNPFSVEIRYNLASLYYNEKEYEKALPELMLVKAWNQNEPDISSNMLIAKIYQLENKQFLAKKYVDAVLAGYPENQQLINLSKKLAGPDYQQVQIPVNLPPLGQLD